MHDFVNNLTPPNVSELFSYSSEKNITLIQGPQRLAISILNI